MEAARVLAAIADRPLTVDELRAGLQHQSPVRGCWCRTCKPAPASEWRDAREGA